MKQSAIQHLIEILYESFEMLGARFSPLDLEKLAVILHKNMSVQTRYYHSLDHVLSFHDPANPIQSLAALFHDIVYYQVDQGFSPEIERVISDYILERGTDIYLTQRSPDEDRLYQMTLDVFDFTPGQKLHIKNGLNEFLSALFMNKKLEGVLPEPELLKMTACVEATIPFRGENERGESHFELLASRLEAVNARYNLRLDLQQIQIAVQTAVRFANQDVASFAEQDPGRYLDTTWKLLPETNEALRSRDLYSIRDYRKALLQTATFLNDLDPDLVFHQYKGVPGQPLFQKMTRQAHQNVRIAREYLRIKLLAITLLEALAEVTGGDAPLSLFMGNIPTSQGKTSRMEDYLPKPPPAPFIDRSSAVYNLLVLDRESETIFDLKNAPLSLFLYCSLPPERFARLTEVGELMFRGQASAHDFLAAVDRPVLEAAARACAALALTRRADLLGIAKIEPS